jgi:plastocyanin
MGCGAGSDDSKPKTTKLSPTKTTQPTVNDNAQPSSANAKASAEDTTDNKGVDSAGAVGDLVGRIVFEGALPEPTLIVAQGDSKMKDAEVCAADDVLDESLRVNEAADNGLVGVFIYLAKRPKGSAKETGTSEPTDFDQKGCRFLQRSLVVRTGQPVRVLSGDAVPHNVHTYPKRNTPFNQTIRPNDRDGVELTYAIGEVEPFEVKCDIHTWMRAYHLPLDHSFATVTDDEGRFEIKGLPAGKHKFRIWHERAKFLERGYVVEIQADQPTRLELSYPAEKFPAP